MSAAAMTVEWHDSGREPRNPPNPAYPNGIDVDCTLGAVGCKVDLPYPAKRCGHFTVRCSICKSSAAITTAGRPDDPRSVKIPCRLEGTA